MQIIEAKTLKARMENGEKINLLDVRQPEEYEEFNIGGKLLPLGEIVSMQTDDIEDWKNEEVICCCRSGQRSMQAALVLETMGFTNVVNLVGGLNNWKDVFGY
jgi:rhodanese-related sulfurtransferase